MSRIMSCGICFLLVLGVASVRGEDRIPVESDFYPITKFEIPQGVNLEVGAICLLPNGKLAVSSRRGEIWMVTDPFAPEVKASQFQRFAHGLHEVLGLAERDGWLYVVQRCDVSRLKDRDGDGEADLFEVVNDEFELNGDYHEYTFGSKFDAHGDLWLVLCLTGSFSSEDKFRGWCLRVNADGKLVPTTSGIRSPGGIGFGPNGDVFYTDNQGPWNGTCELKQLVPGKFVGHPGGFRWYDVPGVKDVMGAKPAEPQSGSRFHVEAEKIPEYLPPVVMFPYSKMGNSSSGVTYDNSGGKFGPFAGQMFVADQSFSTVMRVSLEQVNGRYQGACYNFREGFGSGNVPIEMTTSGSMFVGGTNRGWGSRGKAPFALERMDWSGKVPFEIHEMRAKPDGFELTFTEPVNPLLAGDAKSYALETYTYIFQSSYGSPEVDHTTPTVESATVAADGKSVRLKVNGLQKGHVHHLQAAAIRSAAGHPLLHHEAYYTLMQIPAE